MPELKFRDDPAALERLTKAQSAIDEYSASHPNEFNEQEHQEFRELLKERAAALSEATGLNIASFAE